MNNIIDKKELEKIISECIHNELSKYLYEGIEFDYTDNTVSYKSNHQKNVDTSLKNNPTVDTTLIPGVEVWSIFKRKKEDGNTYDGNPLIYAMKGEGWTFKSKKDKKQIYSQFHKIADKFVRLHPVGTTILVPSGNALNKYIADVVISKSNHAILVKNVVSKLTVEEVNDMVLDNNSVFKSFYGNEFEDAYNKLQGYFNRMNNKRNGYFSRHFVKDNIMRNILDVTFKKSDDFCADDAKLINNQHVLIIDDTVSRGQTVKEICKIINETFNPKSVTVLTLFSKKY